MAERVGRLGPWNPYRSIVAGLLPSRPRMNPVLTLALRSLVRNRRRSAIALAAVGFGVAALILAGGFVDSLLVKLREDTIYSQLGHIQIRDVKPPGWRSGFYRTSRRAP